MEEKFNNIKKAGILGILGNLFLLIIKASIGIISRSQAMIADSINSASDILSSLMTFIGNKISSEPEDNTHNFGHGKAEYIFSLFISITMLGISITLLIDSIKSLILKSHFEFSIWLVVVCIITIIIKFCLFLYTNNMYKKYDNILLKANSQDHRNDCVVTTFTLISVLLSLVNIYWFDGIVGIGISAWIFISGLKIFIESYNILMDISLDDNTKETIMEVVRSHDNIIDITNLYAIPIGYNYVVIFTISVDGNMSTFESHELADHLENEISNFSKIDRTIIHVNPI